MLEEAISTTPPGTGKLRPTARRVAKLSSDEIFQRLRLAIMERRLPPGTQLVEQRLAAIFKVSRTKVREAIGRLVHDCVATNIPNRGAFVSSPSVEQAHEVFAARQLIEPALIREVTQLATAALASRTGDPVGVGIGAWLALATVAGLAVSVGRVVERKLPMAAVRRIAAGLFAVFGLLALIAAV